MPKGYAPTAFVSSTCYDLSQIRVDLSEFLRSLGIEPLLSELSAFPVNPHAGTVENCVNAVKERGDIFILIVGAKYGSQISGKSITNLEYLAAKTKGIPIYVFVSQPIIHALPIWKDNPHGDYNKIVDSTQLFEFVDQLRNSKEHWVYPFQHAKEIIDTLRQQLAFLFMESLLYREKFRVADLPESLRYLSGKCLKIVIERPVAWEYLLFANTMKEEIIKLKHFKWDMSYSLKIGRTHRLDNVSEIINWIQTKFNDILLLVHSAEKLMNVAIQDALGPSGVPGNPEHLVYVARRMTEIYKSLLEWTIEFNLLEIDPEFETLMALLSKFSSDVINEIESMPETFISEIQKGVEVVAKGGKFTASLEFKFAIPKSDEAMAEMNRVMSRYHP